MQLSEKQKRYLRGLGHQLRPVVIIGQKGMREAVMNEVESALLGHELIKVKVKVGEHAQRDAVISEICDSTKATLIQRIGHTALFYRANPKKKKNRIELSIQS